MLNLIIPFTIQNFMEVYPQTKPVRITGSLYQFNEIQGGNTVFLVTANEVIIVDAGTFPSDGKRMMEQILSVTDKPVSYIILTHYHPDHTGGLVCLPSSATVIGHKNILEHLKRNEARIKNSVEKELPARIDELKKQIEILNHGDSNRIGTEKKLQDLVQFFREMQEARIIYPSLTFQDQYTLISGKDTIRLIYPGPAHTRCNILVYFVNQRALHTGDMVFNGRLPYIMLPDGPDTKNWIHQLEQTLNWDVDIVIPGHGQRTDKKGIQQQIRYLKTLRESVANAINQRKSLVEAQKEIVLPEFNHLEGQNRLKQNIESVYQEFTHP